MIMYYAQTYILTEVQYLCAIYRLCSPPLDSKLTMKALGILVNIFHDSESAESAMCNHGSGLLTTVVAVLTSNPPCEVQEQVMCVLINMCTASVKGCDLLIGSDDLMRCIYKLLVSVLQYNYCIHVSSM